MKYSDLMMQWLVERGYTHCFTLGGGNIMHLIESASRSMTLIPVIHEVASGVAVEYFNESNLLGKKAFALVTAGPGLTNIITAMAGAYLENRELLVIGGQVKSSDLARGKLRQRGIQEIDGVSLTQAVTIRSIGLDDVIDESAFDAAIAPEETGRKGPVFLEVCLDVQAREVDPMKLSMSRALSKPIFAQPKDSDIDAIASIMVDSRRPIILIGGGVDRQAMGEVMPILEELGVPLMTTYNGTDRIDSGHPLYFGRPNTWGMRYSNILFQQADTVIAVGTRLGMQQTGFNWQEFAPLAKIVQVEIDPAELTKGHPRVDLAIRADAKLVLKKMAGMKTRDLAEWRSFCAMVKAELPLVESFNSCADGFIDPYQFYQDLTRKLTSADVMIPCSSGGAFTVAYQSMSQKAGQIIISNKSLASMGYGLSGAIGAALANPGRRTVLVEGDGGFAQNLQEIGTVAINKLPIKMFIFSNEGYASIRMTQANYFGGRYVGCDKKTGLGLPDWGAIFAAYGVKSITLQPGWQNDQTVLSLLDAAEPAAFIVPVDPAQTYWPKISSRVTATGTMESNPLHLMSPPLEEALAAKVMPFLTMQKINA